MITMNAINEFLAVKELAVAGVSRDKKKFGGMVFQELKEKGYTIFPVNPNAETIYDTTCFKSVSDLPASTTNLYIVTPKKHTLEVIKQAVARGIKNIWIQQSSDTPEAIKLCMANNINLIHGECIIMFISPTKSFHKFHKFLRKLFGGMPR